jgi:hypothetical protein
MFWAGRPVTVLRTWLDKLADIIGTVFSKQKKTMNGTKAKDCKDLQHPHLKVFVKVEQQIYFFPPRQSSQACAQGTLFIGPTLSGETPGPRQSWYCLSQEVIAALW